MEYVFTCINKKHFTNYSMNKSVFEFFPAFAYCAVLALNFGELISTEGAINGEFVYTCGFVIVLYMIWGETYDLFGTALKPQFGYSEITVFWSIYKEIEQCVLALLLIKVQIINKSLLLFSLLYSTIKSLSLTQQSFLCYKVSVQLLNRIKLKIKTLPLQ